MPIGPSVENLILDELQLSHAYGVPLVFCTRTGPHSAKSRTFRHDAFASGYTLPDLGHQTEGGSPSPSRRMMRNRICDNLYSLTKVTASRSVNLAVAMSSNGQLAPVFPVIFPDSGPHFCSPHSTGAPRELTWRPGHCPHHLFSRLKGQLRSASRNSLERKVLSTFGRGSASKHRCCRALQRSSSTE